MKKEFSLAGHEYIELNKLLKLLRLVQTGGEANIRIENNEVLVDGTVETQKRKKLRPGNQVNYNGYTVIITE